MHNRITTQQPHKIVIDKILIEVLNIQPSLLTVVFKIDKSEHNFQNLPVDGDVKDYD